MPVSRRRPVRRRGSSRRRKLVWATSQFSGVTLPMAGSQPGFAVDLLEDLHQMPTPSEPALSTMGATVMRTHGIIQFQLGVSVPGNFAKVSYGLSVDQIRNVSIGPTPGGTPPMDPASANTPGVNTGLYKGVDWALFDQWIQTTGWTSNLLANATNTWVESRLVDVRSRRKVQEMDQTWALSFYVEPSGTDPQAVCSGFFRTLIALP